MEVKQESRKRMKVEAEWRRAGSGVVEVERSAWEKLQVSSKHPHLSLLIFYVLVFMDINF